MSNARPGTLATLKRMAAACDNRVMLWCPDSKLVVHVRADDSANSGRQPSQGRSDKPMANALVLVTTGV